ncbi:MAG TPA: TonB-dependent receptor [Gemmatimonadales bacterium]|jgi:hypothetical protein|nr:TonB-dependent receptor [Gemmatimonadales bacterium]
MALFLSGLTAMLLVQTPQAAVVGTVRDESTGRPVAGALVSLPDLNRGTTTDETGRYSLTGVPPGPQHLSVRCFGYARRELHALVPRSGALTINVSLHPQPYSLPALEVRSPLPVRGLESPDETPDSDRGVSIAAVRNHPLLAEPDVFMALGGGHIVLEPESPNGVHVRGGASDQTGYLLDGIPVLSPYHAAGVFSAWNPDAIARVDLWSSAPRPADPDALSGTIAAVTRSPGSRLGAQGGLSTTHTRLTLDGPLGRTGVGFLLSRRWGFPGIVAPDGERSYLRGGTGDWLGKLEATALGGKLRILGYGSEDELDAAATARETRSPESPRNLFEWGTESYGAEWSRAFSRTAVRLVGWSASSGAAVAWTMDSGRVHLSSARRDRGVLTSVERRSGRAGTALGLKVEWRRISYTVTPDSAGEPGSALEVRAPVATAFAEHRRTLDPVQVRLGASLSSAAGEVHLGPRAEARWKLSAPLTLSGSLARVHQFAQSLRNSESVVGNVFPADLYVAAGAAGVPVARSEQAAIALDYRPAAGVRLAAQAYERGMSGLLLVAPREGQPFSTGRFGVGSARSRGVSLDAAVATARYGLLAAYGFQRVRFRDGGSGYVPGHGARHLFEGGVIVFPTATTAVRLGIAGAAGRRATNVAGGFEWEACNLLDRGCEFGGSPHHTGEPLGATALPAYLRVDLGLRKHWHLRLGGRDASIALFGTVTNLFGRMNVLAYARDPSGGLAPIEMRPLAPLVVGLDWRL